MATATVKYTKTEAERMLELMFQKYLPCKAYDKLNVEITDVDECDSPKKCESNHPYSFNYPCPVRILEEIMNPNGLIPAIKELRAITGWGLRESKDYVEYIARVIKR